MNPASQESSFSTVPHGRSRCIEGFTLLEVLVVVAIIALLVAILVPSLSEARDQARSAKCLANMQDMGTGMNTFASGHRNRFQVVSHVASTADLQDIGDRNQSLFAYESGTGASPPNLLGWPVVLAREGGARGMKRNADWGVVGNVAAYANKSAIPKIEQLSCPADKAQLNCFATPEAPSIPPGAGTQPWYWGYLSYGINTDIAGVGEGPPAGRGVWKDGRKSGEPGAGAELFGRLDKVIRPSEVMMFVDAGLGDKTLINFGAAGAPTTIGTGSPNNGQNPRGPLLEYSDRAYSLKLRHERHRRASLNLAFADGHGAFAKRVNGNPHNPTNNNDSSVMLPSWRYLPKIRVSPYNSGTYPGSPP
jgi:prepilin-type N-terminal cleavage/methylation domain-containing protein/prepilin-type processing-associated H-X9-DG protein